MQRRDLMILLAATAANTRAAEPGLQFPADFGAHPASRTEWWYLTGNLQADARLCGFQLTFFRSSTGLATDRASRFAATELVFAHAALTDLAQRRLRHDQRIARSGFGVAQAGTGDTDVVLRDWRLRRSAGGYVAVLTSDSAGFALDLRATPTQPLLLQGEAGLSRKGPLPEHASRYYSEPQLAVQGTLTLEGSPIAVTGRAWLDHEWSDTFMPAQAVGWDWIGMNLDDGSALTAFRLRSADGSSVYAGGSFRRRGEGVRSFGPDEVTFTPGRVWQSASSKARYPVHWTVTTPAGRFTVAALLDDQELDSRGSTGSIYWEGLSDLLDDAGKRIGRGYLEMTGYAAALRL
ncbi:MAG: carotenoid 1,2-hydratase [Burkholderiales bacterium]